VESAGIRTQTKRSGPGRWHDRAWSGSGGADKVPGPLPAFGRARPWLLNEILINSLIDQHVAEEF
jgi:hypothetical protein